MVTLESDTLVFRFPALHERATLRVSFQRTLRVPDDGREYPLPAGLGRFPVRHAEDHAVRLPKEVGRRGGVLLPMYQAEALWIDFGGSWGDEAWPMAVQVATGKICAITGSAWREGIIRSPQQNYAVTPEQPWLDGYAVDAGTIRQFVAMPLGRGYTVEEQRAGSAEWGGLQIRAVPLRKDVWLRERKARSRVQAYDGMVSQCRVAEPMGLAPGGRIRQEIYRDRRPLTDWDHDRSARVFVHLLNSRDWARVTNEAPPSTPISREAYLRAGIPWFDHYRDDSSALPGGQGLGGIRSTGEMGATVDVPPVNDPLSAPGVTIIQTGPDRRERVVKVGEF